LKEGGLSGKKQRHDGSGGKHQDDVADVTTVVGVAGGDQTAAPDKVDGALTQRLASEQENGEQSSIYCIFLWNDCSLSLGGRQL
jgi:hypothetical protein